MNKIKLDGPITLSSIKTIQSAFDKEDMFGKPSPQDVLETSRMYGPSG